MKTICTSLPIYDRLEKQCFERGRAGGFNTPVPICCPRHRLPSFQYNAGSVDIGAANGAYLVSTSGVTTDITSYFDAFSFIFSYPVGTDIFYLYYGDTLKYLLPEGIYYLKITHVNGYVFYSEWFKVTCIYKNLVTGWQNSTYNTFTTSNDDISSAISTGAGSKVGYTLGKVSVIKGEQLNISFYAVLNSGEAPRIVLAEDATLAVKGSDIATITAGVNNITLTANATDEFYLCVYNTLAANFSLTDIELRRSYSESHIIFNFSNSCDLGDILYQSTFTQTIWLDSETMEIFFQQDEQGVKNGEGRYVRVLARQVKKYIARTKEMPDFMVEVFNRMKLHDTVELIDLVGNVNDIYNLEVEHEWLHDDKYYAKIDLTFDYNEAFVVAGCCNNFN